MTQPELQDILRRLQVYYSPIEAKKWLRLPHPQLDNKLPLFCRYAEVLTVIDRLDSGAYL